MKQYTVFRRPKNDDAFSSIPDNNRIFESYHRALDAINDVRTANQMYRVPRPTKEIPLLIELPSEWIELWISDRPCFKTDANIMREGPAQQEIRGSSRSVRMDDKI